MSHGMRGRKGNYSKWKRFFARKPLRVDVARNTLRSMNLTKLLSRPEWTQEKLAAAVRKRGQPKTTQATISRLVTRTRCASMEFALALEEATGGLVRAEDLPLSKRTWQALRRLRKMVRIAGAAA